MFRKRIGFRRWPWIDSSILYLEAGGPYTPPYIRYDVARLSPDMAWWVASTNDTLSSVRCYLPSFSWSATWSLTMCSLKELVQHRGIFPDTHETSVITVNCNCNWNCKILKNNDPVNCNYNCNWEIKKITETEKLNQLSNRKIAITEKFLDCKLSPLKRFRLLAQDDQPFMSHSYCCLQYCWQWTYFILCWQQAYAQNDGLHFCIVNELKYPLLSPLAQDLLSAPAYVKRVFSVCGELTAGSRNRLTKDLEKRTFLKMNRKYYR